MDPNANLEEQRTIYLRLLGFKDSEGFDIEEDATRLAELVDSLDTWLKGGGFLPKEWGEARQFGTLSPPSGVS